MKKLMLAAGLCVVAFILAPAASANAEEVTGECEIKGSATFGEALTGTPKNTTYSFASNGVNCNGVNANHEVVKAVALEGSSATVSGKGELSCSAANGLEVTGKAQGKGTIELKGKTVPGGAAVTVKVENFKFDFGGTGPLVNFDTSGGNGGGINAAGDANFLTPNNAEENKATLEKCSGTGATSLNFQAFTAGKIG
jgi:hypothetical protein